MDTPTSQSPTTAQTAALAPAPCSALTFDELCRDLSVTREEREALAHHLAGTRYRETLKLIDPPITRAAIAAACFAQDGKVSVVRGKHLLRIEPNADAEQRPRT